MKKEWLLDIYYSNNGDIERINALLEEKFSGQPRKRKLSVFEKFLNSRLELNSKVLNLASMEVTPEEAVFLSLFPPAAMVETLDLRQNHIGDEGLESLAYSPVLKNIRVLDLRNNQITRTGVQALLESENFTLLEKLDLRSNPLAKLWADKFSVTGKVKFPNLAEIQI